jgi:branched-chain amino acid transport system substrate-binding protein
VYRKGGFMKKSLLLGVFVAALLLLAVGVAACGDDTTETTAAPTETTAEGTEPTEGVTTTAGSGSTESSEPASTEPIKVGVVYAMTGDMAVATQLALAALKMEVDDVNAKGGINGQQVELILQDDKGDATTGTAALTKVLDENVSVIFGSAAEVVQYACEPIVEEAGVPWVATSTPGENVEKGEVYWTFHSSDGAVFQADVYLQLAQKEGWKNIMIVHDNIPLDIDSSETLLETATAAGITAYKLPDVFGVVETNMAPIANKIMAEVKARQPEAVYVLSGQIPLTYLMKELHAQGFDKAKVFGPTTGTPYIFSLGTAQMEGAYLCSSAYVNPEGMPDSYGGKQLVTDFYSRWKENQEEDLDFFGGLGHHTWSVLKAGLEGGGGDRQKIRDTLENLSDFQTAGWGKISYSPNHHIPANTDLSVWRIEDGKFVYGYSIIATNRWGD